MTFIQPKNFNDFLDRYPDSIQIMAKSLLWKFHAFTDGAFSDLCQQIAVFLLHSKAIDKFEVTEGLFFKYLYHVVSRHYYTLHTSSQLDSHVTNSVAESLSAPVYSNRLGQSTTLEDLLHDNGHAQQRIEARRSVDELRLALSTHRRAAQVLAVYELVLQGYTQSEIAKRLGMKRKAVLWIYSVIISIAENLNSEPLSRGK